MPCGVCLSGAEPLFPSAPQAYTDSFRHDNLLLHLQRGLIAERQRNDSAARRDLETSIKLLPTGPAYYSLGNIARRSGQLGEAKEYYAAAAGAQGEVGEAATAALMRLDLPDNPGKYLRTQAGLDPAGKLVVAIGNPTRVPVTSCPLPIHSWSVGPVARVLRI